MKQRLLSLFIVVLGVCTGAEAGNLMIGSTTLEVGKSYNSLNGPSSLWAGTITFTDATHVTFDGVTLNFNTANSIAISTDIPGLTITLVGENKIQGDGTKKGLYFSQSVTIKGDGSLDIVASENGIEGSGGRDGVRYYHTGDLCYWHESGNIMYSGRIDQQAKIQGFRVELGEIEHHARQFYQNERRVMAIAFQNAQNLTEIAMFIEAQEEDSKELVAYLRSKMPSYMIPTRFQIGRAHV